MTGLASFAAVHILSPLAALAAPSVAALPAQGQVEAAWNIEVDALDINQVPQRTVGMPDGGAFVLQRLVENSTTVAVVGIRLDPNGDEMWQITRPLPGGAAPHGYDRVADAAVASNRDLYLVVGASPTAELIRIDPATGAIRWSRTIQQSTSIPFYPNTIATSTGGLVYVGGSRVNPGSNNGRFEVHAYNLNGIRQWANDDAIGVLHGLSVDSGSGEVVAYGQSHVYSPYLAGVVVRYSQSGDMRWRDITSTWGMIGWDWGSLWHDPVDDLVIDGSGNAYALANGHAGFDPWLNPIAFVVESTQPDGTSRYSTQYIGEYDLSTNEVGDLYAAAVAADSNGNAYVVGYEEDCASGCTREFTLWSFDAAGVERWKRTPSVAAGASGFGLAVHVDQDDRILVHGWINGDNDAVDASFLPDGTELGATVRPVDDPVGFGVALLDYAEDFSGNSFLNYGVSGPGGFSTTRLARFMAGESVGAAYCAPAVPNSTGAPAELVALGRDSVEADNVTLRVEQLPPGAATFMLASLTEANVPGVGGGQGTLCLGGAIGRYVGPGQIRSADSSGAAWLQLDLSAIPQPTGTVPAIAGDVWRIQAWYRDANPASTSNLSNGIALTVTP